MGVLKEDEEVVSLPSGCCFLQDQLQVIEKHNNSPPNLDGVEEILGYKFSNRSLLEEAFIHPSCYNFRVGTMNSCHVSYERLEFVGAAVLNMVIAKEMFSLYPDFAPGHLTLLRAANIHHEKLARVAIKHGFHHYLHYKITNFDKQIQEFSKAILEYPVHSNGLIKAPKFLAHVVGATVGAIFIDTKSSFDTTWKIIKELLKPIIDHETLEVHPMTELQELCQKYKLKLQIIKDSTSNKENTMKVDVQVNEKVVGTGTHRSKKEIAQNRAAKDAILKLKAGALKDFVHLEVLDQKMEVIMKEEEEEEEENDSLLFETESARNLNEVEDVLGYKFIDKRLLEEAFTHRTYYENQDIMNSCIMSYERLEFVGDAVLSTLIANEMYSLYPELPPGKLSRLMAANVDNEKLARVAIKHGFHHYLRYKATRVEEQIQEFSVAIMEYPVHSNRLIEVPKSLADVVEAIIGAIFIDSNSSLDTVWKIIRELLKPMIGPETLEMHPMTELLELCQKNKLELQINKDLWDKKENKGRVDVLVDDKLVGTGTHVIKKEIAQNRAAKAALNNLKSKLAAKNVTE
ncbi:Ribonuclease III domain [Macleaya cordata]|uniref:Ribonuclease III domain n=1 Tax=Macleaya cordata TaxID=56857 RepID=A0A200QH20_MACCD|nr:Ribonuclease III domain [Macleaya cordata]